MVMKRYILTCVCGGMLAGSVMAQQQDSIAKCEMPLLLRIPQCNEEVRLTQPIV